jgi:hypothetical protein
MMEIVLIAGMLITVPALAWLSGSARAKRLPRGAVQAFLLVVGVLLCLIALKAAKILFVVAAPALLFLAILFGGRKRK